MSSRDNWRRAMATHDPWVIGGAILGVLFAAFVLLLSAPWFAAGLFAARVTGDPARALRIIDRSPAGRYARRRPS